MSRNTARVDHQRGSMKRGIQWLSTRLEPGREADRCVVLGCGRPTMQATGKGLGSSHCRAHLEHRARHGHYTKPSFMASELAPYLRSALSFIRPRLQSDRLIKKTVMRLAVLIESAPFEAATRLRGLPASTRADVMFGRLSRGGVKPERILAAAISIAAIMKEDARLPRGDKEFARVQLGKMLHRMRSGTHIVHEMWVGDRSYRNELHKYPRSSGQVLRIIGRRVEEICELAMASAVDSVIALKVKRYDAPQRQRQKLSGAARDGGPASITALQADGGRGVVAHTNEGKSYRIIPRSPTSSPPVIGHAVDEYTRSQDYTVFPL